MQAAAEVLGRCERDSRIVVRGSVGGEGGGSAALVLVLVVVCAWGWGNAGAGKGA